MSKPDLEAQKIEKKFSPIKLDTVLVLILNRTFVLPTPKQEPEPEPKSEL